MDRRPLLDREIEGVAEELTHLRLVAPGQRSAGTLGERGLELGEQLEHRASPPRRPRRNGCGARARTLVGFGPLKTLDASLDEDRRRELSRAWLDFTEAMR